MIDRLFLDHPRSVDEGYFQHQRMAFGYGIALLVAGLACLLHGLIPAFCVTSGSRRVAALNDEMSSRRRRATESLMMR